MLSAAMCERNELEPWSASVLLVILVAAAVAVRGANF